MKIRTAAVGAGLVLALAAAHDTPTTPSLVGSGPGSVSGNLRPGTVPAAYAALVEDAGRTCPQITAALLAAQINQESGFDPRSVSDTNAEGIAQFEPGTAASNHVDPWDPDSAIHGMARLDCANYRRFGSVPLALAAYNGGPGVVGHWQDVGQTRNYVHSILAAVAHYTTPTSPAPVTIPTPTPSGAGSSPLSSTEQELQQLWDDLHSPPPGTGGTG